MRTTPLGTSDLLSTRLIYGCMRIAGTWNPEKIDDAGRKRARDAVIAAWEAGYRHFDHADIYCAGGCETLFGRIMADVPGMRDAILITTKCGIRFPGRPNADSPKRYDFARGHILRSVDGSLERLGVETIDVLLLHRPDVLMDPDEVAGAFDTLRRNGKVRQFGVSNFTPSQLDTLQAALPMPLVCNQIRLHPAHLEPFIDGSLDQCTRLKITPTAWSPVAGGMFGAGGTVNDDHPRREALVELNRLLDAEAERFGVDRSALVCAWLMRHPSGVLPIIGTTDPARIADAAKADEIEIDRETWYRIYGAAGGPLP